MIMVKETEEEISILVKVDDIYNSIVNYVIINYMMHARFFSGGALAPLAPPQIRP